MIGQAYRMHGYKSTLTLGEDRMSKELLLRVAEAGRRIGVGRSKAYELVASGKLASVKISERSIRVPVTALEEYVRRLEEEAGITGEEA